MENDIRKQMLDLNECEICELFIPLPILQKTIYFAAIVYIVVL